MLAVLTAMLAGGLVGTVRGRRARRRAGDSGPSRRSGDRMRERGRGGPEGGKPREVVRHEEELDVGIAERELGAVRGRKRVETEAADRVVPRRVEHDEIARTAPNDEDSGEVEFLPDGSVSIPLLEEELVVTKRTVVRERVVVRKRTETANQRVRADVRKERLELDTVGDVELDEADY